MAEQKDACLLAQRIPEAFATRYVYPLLVPGNLQDLKKEIGYESSDDGEQNISFKFMRILKDKEKKEDAVYSDIFHLKCNGDLFIIKSKESETDGMPKIEIGTIENVVNAVANFIDRIDQQ